jgi:hypothetical protein
MTTLPSPMPRLEASDEEWNNYMDKLTENELLELITFFEKRYQEAHAEAGWN